MLLRQHDSQAKKNTSYLVLERKIFAEIEIVIDFRARLTHSESGVASVCCGAALMP